MKEFFVDTKFRPESLAAIERCNAIIDEYNRQGFRLTLRQLYYQLVSRDVIPNTPREYGKLSALLTNARLAGLVDWEAIEDRVRVPRKASEFAGMQDLVETAIRAYRLDRWAGQEYYVELWVEKDALAGVLRPIADKFHITLMVNRGYSSITAMYEAAERIKDKPQPGKTILYLGDHDPSGEDMVRDVQDRLDRFGADCSVIKIGLTMAQVRKYNPPPNPAKMSDARAAKYVAEHGSQSWEVDALPPQELTRIITAALNKLTDWDMMNAVIAREDADKEWLRKTASRRKA